MSKRSTRKPAKPLVAAPIGDDASAAWRLGDYRMDRLEDHVGRELQRGTIRPRLFVRGRCGYVSAWTCPPLTVVAAALGYEVAL